MPSLTPLQRRWVIVALIFCAMVLNYVDRQIVSILKPELMKEFGIDDVGYASLVNVFLICYACFYPIAGWMADRFGVKRVMFGGIIMWSVACFCAGLSSTLGRLTLFRGMLGMAEPMAYPAQLRAVTTWFSGKLRATANGICVAGGSIGALIAPPLVSWLTIHFNWHVAFMVPAVMGLGIAALWWWLYRDPPPEMVQAVEAEDKSDAEAFTWSQLWRTKTLWGIILIRFISDPVWYFCLFWLAGYLRDRSGLTLAEVGMVGWIPFLAADLGGVGSAMWSDWLVRRGMEPLRARKVMLTGMAVLAPLVALIPHFHHPAITLMLFGIVGAVCLSWLFSLSVVMAETFPKKNVASVLGIAGGFGAAGGMAFNYYIGNAMKSFGDTKLFIVMALLHPLAVILLWKVIRPERPPRPE